MTVYLFDNNKALIGEIVPLDYTQKSILGGTITASITAIYSPEIESAHYFGSKDIDDENTFHLYRVTSKKKRNGLLELSGIHILFDELQGHVIRDIRPNNVTPATALGRILENTDWQVGIQSATGTASSTYYYQSTLSAFWDFIKTWRVEFKPRLVFTNGVITGRFIDIYNNMSANYGKWYEYGDKLITVEAEQANENIYTALVGLGKGEETGDGFGRKINFTDVWWTVDNGDPVDKPGGQDYVSLPSAVAIYGFREAVVDFPDIESPQELLQATYLELLNVARPKVEFSASAIETEQIELGETVTVIRDDLGIRYQTRVFELTRNFLNKTVKSFRFGDRIITSSAERIREDREKIDEKIKEQRSLLEAVRSTITDAYWGTDGYNYDLEVGNEYGLPAGLYSFDRPIDQDPTEVIYIGAGKALIANSKNPNGEWEWRTALTPEGFVGDQIIANSITANKLAADVGQSLDLSSNESIGLIVESEVEEQLSDPDVQDRFKGDDGISVGTVTAHYYLSTSPTILTGGSWSETYPGWESGKYLWTKTVTTYSDDTESETTPVNVSGASGVDGADGRGIQDAYPQYYLSTSRTSQTGGSWQNTMPAWVEGQYMWTRMAIVLTNPTEIKYTDPTLHTELEEIHSRITTHQAEIEVNKTNITSLVSQTEAIETNLGSQITELSNTVTQNYNSTTENYGRLVTRITETETEIEDINSYIQRGVDDDMNPQIIMGRSDQDKRWVWNYEAGMYIEDGGVVTFEASDQQVKTTRLVVLQSIDFGNHVAQKYGDKYTIFLPSGG